MKNNLGIAGDKIFADFHVHFGQFYDVYYQPATVIKTLAQNGIKMAWCSSTTSLSWNSIEEKNYILTHIEEEINEALAMAKKFGISLVPLFRVSPKSIDGKHIADIMACSNYKGFKLHPKDEENDNETFIKAIMGEVCQYASAHLMPILIHTGIDSVDSPKRFEYLFSEYKNVKFVLAHCKAVNEIIELFSKYNNVFGDTAFCPEENYKLICNAGFENRIQFGTDFPITHWYENEYQGIKNNLSKSYKNTLKEFNNYLL